ncbi:MAG: hypothetical protein HQK96_04085 [Nitrospirae bacterium]|nr:hypothetical protein [Nitrospirota bacterium]
MYRYSKNIGDPSVVLELMVFDEANVGVSGLLPVLTIRNIESNEFLDFADNTFKSSWWTQKTVSMIEVDAINSKGCYNYLWNSRLSVLNGGEFAIEYDAMHINFGKDVDYIWFTNYDSSDVEKFLNNKRYIDKTSPSLKDVLYDDDRTTVIKSWSLESDTNKDVRTPD